MQLNSKGPTTGIPRVLLACCLALFIASLILKTGEGSQGTRGLIDWHEPIQGMANGRKQAKPLLLLFVRPATERTRIVDSTVLSNRNVAAIAEKYFYPIRIESRAGHNLPLINNLFDKYRVFQLPTLMIATPKGSEVAIIVGSPSATQTYQFLMTNLVSDHAKEVAKPDSKAQEKD